MEDIKQRDGESLQSYMTWFNDASATVKMADRSLVHMAIVSGVYRRTEFAWDLTKQEMRNLTDFYQRAEQYLHLKATNAILMVMALFGTSRLFKEEDEEKNDDGLGK